MTELVDSLGEIAELFDAYLIDQWGVLHNGREAYPHAVEATRALRMSGAPIVVLSNSGKRAATNAIRIERFGFGPENRTHVLSSGEALWLDAHAGLIEAAGKTARRYHLIMRNMEEIEQWWAGLEQFELVDEPERADASLLLSIADGSAAADYDSLLARILASKVALFCANPDLVGLTHNGRQVGTGTIARRYERKGGFVAYYGKPHAPIFEHAHRLIGKADPSRVLVCGDMFATDIAGGSAYGFKTLFVRNGVNADEFARAETATQIEARIALLAEQAHAPMPDYSIDLLRY